MPVLQKGCCCAELETCAAIIGWLGIIFSIFNIFGYFVMGYHWIDIIIYVLIGVAYLVASALLIKSTKDRKASYVVPWLIIAAIGTIISVILQIVTIIAAPENTPGEAIAGSAIGVCIGIALSIYFWLCIYSYYQQLSNQ